MFNVANQNERKQEVLTLNCTFESINMEGKVICLILEYGNVLTFSKLIQSP